MSHTTSRLRSLIVILFGIYLFVYPWSILLVALDLVPVWGAWVGGALLIIQGTVMGLWLTAHYGRHGALAALLILGISWAVEHLGVLTGFPFGTYSYTDVLIPKIFGIVPLAIPFAWLLVVPAAVGVTERLLGVGNKAAQSARSAWLSRVLGAASFALLLDVTIEPVAVHISGYWIWNDGGGYYGVPNSNFIAWWVTSVLLVGVLYFCIHIRRKAQELAPALQSPGSRPAMLTWLPSALYLLNLTMFVLVNLAHGQIGAAAIGVLILAYLIFEWIEPRLRRWILGVQANRRQPGA